MQMALIWVAYLEKLPSGKSEILFGYLTFDGGMANGFSDKTIRLAIQIAK